MQFTEIDQVYRVYWKSGPYLLHRDYADPSEAKDMAAFLRDEDGVTDVTISPRGQRVGNC